MERFDGSENPQIRSSKATYRSLVIHLVAIYGINYLKWSLRGLRVDWKKTTNLPCH